MNYYGENSNEYLVPLNRGEIISHLKWLYEKYNRLRFYASLDDEELAEMRHATRDDMKSKAEFFQCQAQNQFFFRVVHFGVIEQV